MRTALLLLLSAGAICFAQTTETIPFRAILSPANQVPAVSSPNSGNGTLLLHVVRDAQGVVQSASAEFQLNYRFNNATRIVGMHIHRGAAGTNGPVVIDSGIAAAAAVPVEGPGRIVRMNQSLSAAALEAARDMIQNPGNYYLNVHTPEFPGGEFRGQTQPAQMVVTLATLSPANEVPPVTTNSGSGVGLVRAIVSRNAQGRIDSGNVSFEVDYFGMPDGTVFTGMHVHTGVAGTNGPVTIDSGMTRTDPQGPSGKLQFTGIEVNVANAASQNALEQMVLNPANLYLNVHTLLSPGGAIRGQLRAARMNSFPVRMLPSEQVPPVTNAGDAEARGSYTVFSVPGPNGAVEAAVSMFNVNPRLGSSEFIITGLHIHRGARGTNGPVVIDSGINPGNRPVLPAGAGNLTYLTLGSGGGLETVQALLSNPSNFYINLHTTTAPGGLVRAQLANAPGLPAVNTNGVVSATGDAGSTTVAPGSLVSVYGTNLANVVADLTGFTGTSLPTALNGTQVTIGGRTAPLIYTGPLQIVAQVPFDVATGMQQVSVSSNGAMGLAGSVTVAPFAPYVFRNSLGAAVLRAADLSQVTATNRARSGDTVVIYATGLGQTTPAMASGAFAPMTTFAATQAVTATVNGNPATVVSSIASPNFAGLYQVAVTLPQNVTGDARIRLTIGGQSTAEFTIPVQ